MRARPSRPRISLPRSLSLPVAETPIEKRNPGASLGTGSGHGGAPRPLHAAPTSPAPASGGVRQVPLGSRARRRRLHPVPAAAGRAGGRSSGLGARRCPCGRRLWKPGARVPARAGLTARARRVLRSWVRGSRARAPQEARRGSRRDWGRPRDARLGCAARRREGGGSGEGRAQKERAGARGLSLRVRRRGRRSGRGPGHSPGPPAPGWASARSDGVVGRPGRLAGAREAGQRSRAPWSVLKRPPRVSLRFHSLRPTFLEPGPSGRARPRGDKDGYVPFVGTGHCRLAPRMGRPSPPRPSTRSPSSLCGSAVQPIPPAPVCDPVQVRAVGNLGHSTLPSVILALLSAPHTWRRHPEKPQGLLGTRTPANELTSLTPGKSGAPGPSFQPHLGGSYLISGHLGGLRPCLLCVLNNGLGWKLPDRRSPARLTHEVAEHPGWLLVACWKLPDVLQPTRTLHTQPASVPASCFLRPSLYSEFPSLLSSLANILTAPDWKAFPRPSGSISLLQCDPGALDENFCS
ncbi:collagen alpha-1(I) chain-like [Trachypithecus francoisi]|uniref:collagen alpha-1(I) chain-like n=1 Tax=Trachypithecus francoisi TaxID=54180 RepID=UPI00141A94FF|nr:collagen alpha-1(I) chain-like [Trachypithecus francoisi]